MINRRPSPLDDKGKVINKSNENISNGECR